MGWGHCGTDSRGREIGYSIEATCDYPGCNRTIHRGLSYVCGRMHGEDEHSCEGYFCYEHRTALFIEDYVDKDEEKPLYEQIMTVFHGMDGLLTCYKCYKENEKVLTDEIDYCRAKESERNENA